MSNIICGYSVIFFQRERERVKGVEKEKEKIKESKAYFFFTFSFSFLLSLRKNITLFVDIVLLIINTFSPEKLGMPNKIGVD